MLATGRYLADGSRYWVMLPRRHPSISNFAGQIPRTALDVEIITLKGSASTVRPRSFHRTACCVLTKSLEKER